MSRNRGQSKPKLRDLSVNPLTYEEQTALISAIGAATTPITVTILGAVLVEHELETSLRKRFRIPDDKLWTEKMVGENGPLSTFYRKIMIGHALHLYDGEFRDNLDIVRAVRKAFAHSKRVIDFDNPLVSDEIKTIKIPKNQRRAFRKNATLPPQQAYLTLCLRLVSEMLRQRTTALTRSAKRRQRKNVSLSPFYRALAPSLGIGGLEAFNKNPFFGLATPLANPQSFLPGQSGDPSRSTSLGSPPALLQSLLKTDDNKGK
jgi:hypothetical protein